MGFRLDCIRTNSNIVNDDESAQKFKLMLNELEQLGLDEITDGRYTIGFISSLFNLYYQGIDMGSITSELKHLENPIEYQSNTKEQTQFMREPLKGLWHKHFFPILASSVATNLINDHNKKGGLTKIIEDSLGGKEGIEENDIYKLVDDIVDKSFEDRFNNKEITGEWIIYHKHKAKNCYLYAGPHSKNGLLDDENIKNNILNLKVLVEFPQFKNELPIFTED